MKEAIHDYAGSYVEERASDETFTTGQSYDQVPATTLFCKKCGGKAWFVGQGDYYTVIMCPKCRVELCIHEG